VAVQPCLRELTMTPPTLERYERHQYVEHLMKKPGVEMKRTYTWAPAEDYIRIKVRAVTDKITPWVPVEIPKKGAVIKFQLDAHLREWVLDANGHRVDEYRKSNTNYIDNLDWIENRAKESGLVLKGKDYEPIPVPVAYPGDPFVKMGSRFRGVAIMADTDKFLAALTFGIGDAKAFGFGFMNFRVVG
jgi:hypothetical protein